MSRRQQRLDRTFELSQSQSYGGEVSKPRGSWRELQEVLGYPELLCCNVMRTYRRSRKMCSVNISLVWIILFLLWDGRHQLRTDHSHLSLDTLFHPLWSGAVAINQHSQSIKGRCEKVLLVTQTGGPHTAITKQASIKRLTMPAPE